jgi:hypothetical protein
MGQNGGIPISKKDRLQILAISFKRVLASSSHDAIVRPVLCLVFSQSPEF